MTVFKGIAVLIGMVLAAPAMGAPRPPNIIFIMADDMGIDWVSCYGADHATPNIDRIAEQGVRFNHVWCNPICTPTRLTLLTGMYPFRTGWTDHHDVPRWGGKGFDWEKFTCWARVVRNAGYTTAIGGKWQVNDFRSQADALSQHGFDEHCMWTGYETGNAPPSNERYWNPYLITNGKRKVHKGEFGPSVINDFLVDFIERHRDKPFLVYYPMLMPHGPQVPTPLNKQAPPKSKSELYAGMVTHIDKLVGRITETVDRLKLTDNTMILFTCDNGSSMPGRIGGKPYAKGKGRIANRGAHVPMVVRAPFLTGDGVGRVSDGLIDFSDVYPTLVELAGAKMPKKAIFDGRSFVSLINGTAKQSETRKWVYAQRGDGRMVRDRRFLVDNQGGFYDLKSDLLQKNNLAQTTDRELSGHRDRLKAVLDNMPADAGPPFALYRGKRAKKK